MFKLLLLSRIGFALNHFVRTARRSKFGPWKGFALPLLCICLSALPSACTVSLPKVQPTVSLPEHIYITSPAQDFSGARVAIFPFESPDILPEVLYIQPPDPGYGAAQALYHKLLEQGYFGQLSMQLPQRKSDRTHQLEIARGKGFDLVITGRVLYLFEGTSQLPSRVDVEMTMTEVATGQILLYAEAREADPPFIESDLILVRIQGQNAAPTMALMERNALKFCYLLGAPQ